MGFPINPNNTLDYDNPAPIPTRIWHVDGILAPFDKSTTLDGSRVLHAPNQTEAAEKVLTACRSVRGNEWGWVGQVRVYPHYAWDDPNCPICKRRNAITHCHEGDCPNISKAGTRYCEMHLASNHRTWAAIANDLELDGGEYQDGVNALYAPVTVAPTRLTDEAAGYGEPSEAAMEAAKDVIVTIQESYGIEYKAGEPIDDVEWRLWATAFDAFAAQQAAAAVKERDAEIVARIRAQISLWSGAGDAGECDSTYADGATDALKDAIDEILK